MPNFWNVVNKVIRDADALLLVLDARMVSDTRHAEVENKVKDSQKPLIYVITKSDLVEKDSLDRIKKTLQPCVFVSSKDYHGMNLLRERILIESKRVLGQRRTYYIGVLGYPNVGKSSLINAMKGTKAASTSSVSGHTRGMQKVRADNRIIFLDSPGVIPYKERDAQKHAIIGTIDYHRIRDPDLAVLSLMESFPGLIEKHYGIDELGEDAIELIAKKLNLLLKGARPDVDRASRAILKAWQEGSIKHR